MNIYSGKCGGGPYHGRPLHHGTKRVRVALLLGKKEISLAPRAPLPPDIKAGFYNFDEPSKTWVWEPPK